MATYDTYLTTGLSGVLSLGVRTNSGVSVTDVRGTGDDTTVLGDIGPDVFRSPTGLLGANVNYTYVGTVCDPSGKAVGFVASSTGLTYTVFVPTGVDPATLSLTVFPRSGVDQRTEWDLDTATPVDTAPICFMPGTLVATPGGERAVETLTAGDLVLTSDGGAHPVRWMGRQTVSTRFADPLRVLPVRIMAGALGEGLPRRDLLVSPDHALLLDGALVQAGALVNGAAVRREAAVPEVFTYWHVELADHSLVLAEGVPAETFVDNVARLAFDNWAEHGAAAEPAPVAELALPRAKSARQVPGATRRRLAERAAMLTGKRAAAA